MTTSLLATELGDILLTEAGLEIALEQAPVIVDVLATETGDILLTESGLEIALENGTTFRQYLAAENGDLLLTEDGYYIEIDFSSAVARPTLFIVNMGRMMGR